MKKTLLWAIAGISSLLLVWAVFVTLFMLSIGGSFRGQAFALSALLELLLLVAICVGLTFIVMMTIRAARRA